MKKLFLFLFVLFSVTFSQTIYAEVLSGSGIVPGQIWYSKDSLVEGDTVYIHTAIWNDKDYQISTEVQFYDNKLLLGERSVSVKSNELKDVSISWKVTPGDHAISAKISSSLKEDTSGNKSEISLPRVSSITSKNSVSTTVKNSEGETVNLAEEVTNKVENVVGDDVSNFVSSNFNVVEKFRNNNSEKVTTLKEAAKSELEAIKNEDKGGSSVSDSKTSFEEKTKEPLAYVKLFLFSVLDFILKTSLVFYAISVLLIFVIIRFVYRKIRNR